MTAKPVLVFDASVLSAGKNKDGSRGGIFWASRNLLEQFYKSGKFEMLLYAHISVLPLVQEYVAEQYPAHSFTFINGREANKAVVWCSRLRRRKAQYVRENRYFLKTMCHWAYAVLRVVGSMDIGRMRWTKNISRVNYFFSPMYKIPEIFAKQAHIKKTVMLYDAIPLLYPHLYPNWRKEWLFALVKSMNDTDLYFTDSQSARRDFLSVAPQTPPEHITTAYISTNRPYQPVTDPQKIASVKAKYHIADKKYIYSLCTMDPRKNIPFAVRAFIRFCRQNDINDLIFVLAGSRAREINEHLRQDFPPEIIRRYVCFTGYVDDNDQPALYSGAEFFVYPSLYEGFGMPILEAMCCKTAVICANTSAMPEVIGDCGITFDPTDERALIAAFARYYFDTPFCRARAKKGYERAQTFSWGKCINTIIAKMCP